MTPLERENRDLRRENVRLRERLQDARSEIGDLRRELGADQDAALVRALKAALPVTPQGAWLLAALYRAKGEVVGRESIRRHMPSSDADGMNDCTLKSVLCQLRAGIGRECIRNTFKVGWSLTPAGLAKCDAALSGGRA